MSACACVARRNRPIATGVAGALAVLLACAAAWAESPSARILAPSGNPRPVNAATPEPDARDLIETWRASNRSMPDKRVDKERFLILDRRLAPGKYPRAFLQFRILPAQGEAKAFAEARCPGRTNPIDIQVFYQWSPYLNAWVAQATKGEGVENLCNDAPGFWPPDRIDSLLHPPPLPTPPKISPAEVVTPADGAPERAAILGALRPIYEKAFGPPIDFKVVALRTASGFAFVVVHPQRPGGAPIEKPTWRKALGEPCFQTPSSVEHEYWMQAKAGAWTIGVKNGMCADDSIVGQGDLIGAPPQLVGKDAWPDREFPPALDE